MNVHESFEKSQKVSFQTRVKGFFGK